jgi:hypothetical protein
MSPSGHKERPLWRPPCRLPLAADMRSSEEWARSANSRPEQVQQSEQAYSIASSSAGASDSASSRASSRSLTLASMRFRRLSDNHKGSPQAGIGLSVGFGGVDHRQHRIAPLAGNAFQSSVAPRRKSCSSRRCRWRADVRLALIAAALYALLSMPAMCHVWMR